MALRFLGIEFKLNPLPSLMTGEKVLFFKGWLWAASAKSLPIYRWAFSLPPLVDIGLYVTDRRVLLAGHLCRLLTHQFCLWFDGSHNIPDTDSITDISLGKSPIIGPYIEIVSQIPAKRWYRSRRLRIRLFMRNPQSVYRILSEAIAPAGQS